MSYKTLILGLGNDILSDDGIGPRLIRDLSLFLKGQDIQFVSACCGGLEIVEYIKDFNRVIFIDGIRTQDGKPGNVYHFLPSDFKETMHLSSLHDISFLTALKLGNGLNMNIPDDLHILAVEIIEDRQFGENLTPELEQEYPFIFEKIVVQLKKIMEKDELKS